MTTRTAPTFAAIAAIAALVSAPGVASAAPADDVPVAVAGTIQAGDIPSTFAASTSPSSQVGAADGGSNPLVQAAGKSRQCKAFAKAFGGSPAGVTASAQGAQFDDAGSQASSSVLVLESAAEAVRLYHHAADPELAACLDRLFRITVAQSRDALSGRGVKLVRLTTSTTPKTVPPAGDETTAFETRITMRIAPKGAGSKATTQQATVQVYTDIQFVRVGRALAFYEFLGVDAPLTAVQEPAVAAASARLAGAQGS